MPDQQTNKEEEKKFYRIGEVAQMLKVAPSLLRFWEKEMDCLRNVQKNRKGDRLYTEKNIGDLRMILKLVKAKGMTLQGANEFMNTHYVQSGSDRSAYASLMKIRDFLESLKENL